MRSTSFAAHAARLFGAAVCVAAGLPLLLLTREPSPASEPASSAPRRVNVPYFNVSDVGASKFAETAVFWFGRVTPTDNYADVRIGYNDSEVWVYVVAFDRRIWYDTTPSSSDLTQWDAATLLLNLDGPLGSVPISRTYRFEAQFSWWEPRANYQAAYQGNGSGWAAAGVPISTTAAWRGNAPLDDVDDRGWGMTFHVPFAGLGLSGPPPQETQWGLAIMLHDRDSAAGAPIADQIWPETLNMSSPSTWGQMIFGLPAFTPPPAGARTTATIRHNLNGAAVIDAAAGGTIDNLCPGGSYDIWNVWGNANFAGASGLNIQNQSDISDWPCYAKYYVTFPLTAIPTGKVIVSATLTLHQFGGAGGIGEAEPSLVQLFSVAEDWSESTLTWNNAPLALENVGQAWVDPAPPGCGSTVAWPCFPRTWDVSYALAKAYAGGQPLRLALYEADSAYHSGKYFTSSDTGDWNAAGRPTLMVTWGDPAGAISKSVWPVAIETGRPVTYTLTVLGAAQALTLTDVLPAQVSPPGTIQVSGGGAASYNAGLRQIAWNGSPASGQAVTITFPVTAQVGGPLAIVNTATLTGANVLASSASATFIVDAFKVYLPIVMR